MHKLVNIILLILIQIRGTHRKISNSSKLASVFLCGECVSCVPVYRLCNKFVHQPEFRRHSPNTTHQTVEQKGNIVRRKIGSKSKQCAHSQTSNETRAITHCVRETTTEITTHFCTYTSAYKHTRPLTKTRTYGTRQHTRTHTNSHTHTHTVRGGVSRQ